MTSISVESENVRYTDDYIFSEYNYQITRVTEEEVKDNVRRLSLRPESVTYGFRTSRSIPKLGVMIVGWGGNNGSTLTAGIVANREGIRWRTRTGEQRSNYFGSIFMSSVIKAGVNSNGEEVYLPLGNLLPMVHPNDIVVGGWDINSANIADALERAQVFPYELQSQLRPYLERMNPLPGIYYPSFIASNQSERVDNVVEGTCASSDHLDRVRNDIKNFKNANGLDKVIVLWSGNTERFSDVSEGVHDTADNLLASIDKNHSEIAPSVIYAAAAILEGCAFINGSPQNTLLPGLIELAERCNVFVGGDDLKTGQTKLKSVLVDFLVSAGLKVQSIVSYNHLGNNDGKNLSSAEQFRSKEISKSNVIDDAVSSNSILYEEGEKPDHVVVIKYVPYVRDSKRAMDEYISEIFMGGENTIVIHNTCEDSLLAVPVMLDLVLLTELMQRVSFARIVDMEKPEYESFYSVLSILSYLLKAPVVGDGEVLVNSLFRQRMCIENILRALVGLPPENHMQLEHKTRRRSYNNQRSD